MMSQDHEVGSDQTQIIKGKRTKRQRSSSSTFLVAATTTVTSTSSSAGGDGGGRSVSDEYNSAVSSPVTTTDCTEEEEDMAICLIMLARGAVPSPDLKNSRKADRILLQKISSENSSFYVYECKTCNRTFPSFQALGGHRASHKKPKNSVDEKSKLPLMQQKSSASEEGQNGLFKVSGPALASQASNIIINKANKVHECSICGSEFTSGQALGGHMRRHRTSTTAVIPAATAEVSKNSTEEETDNLDLSMKRRKYLPLDLNLPAPEDDLRETKFQGIVFSTTPALIDCHY
ncbi:unnamed protein product [Thlaspi arvense]|uniref:C2H2-type domain-containing protein n=1 Tax=Thlaspi arvense TaxID=13288 RepID=A0AAU9S8M1_THLAR|nr:unnamed protein product [Thlaspi arvense]